MKFIAKLLRRSDLTFFDVHFRQINAGNQKSLNLSRRVFIDILFPSAPSIAAANGAGGVPAPFHLPVTIYGPGERATPHVVPRSVLPKTVKQKNWRLNGEAVHDPEEDPTRYHSLQADDIAVIGFEGEAFPTYMSIVLLSQSEASDRDLLGEFLSILGKKEMRAIPREQLEEVVQRAATPSHPIRELVDEELDQVVEEAALGSSSAARRLRSSGLARRMSARALQDARRSAEITGRNGEVLLNEWFQAEVEAGRLRSVTWVAEKNAISPWDFLVVEADGTEVRVEAKSTKGPFERNFHISQAEIEWAADVAAPRTDLYRLYELQDEGALLRICLNIRDVATRIMAATSGLGSEIVPDSFTISPAAFGSWSAPILVELSEEPEEE